MKLLKTIFSPMFLVYSTLVLILYAATYGQLWRNYTVAPEQFFYYGGEEYPLDLSLNIAHIRQGYEGDWRAFFNLTTVYPHQPSILKFEYILIGKMGHLLSLDPVDALALSRFIISVFWFLFIYWLILSLFTKRWQQFLAFVFILFGASITEPGGQSFVHAAVFDAQVLFRLTIAMPHYLLGGLTAFVSLFCFSLALKSKRSLGWFILAVIIGSWSALVYGPTIVLILGSIPLFILLRFYQYRTQTLSRSEWIKTLSLSIIYGLFLALPILYVRYVVAIEWQTLKLSTRVEKLNPFRRSFIEYFYSVGILYVLSWFSLPKILRKTHPFFQLIWGWVLLHPLLVFFLAEKIDLNPIRFYLMPYYVVFGILGTIGIETIGQFAARKLPSLKPILIGILFLLIVVPSMFTMYVAFKRFEVCFCIAPYLDYGYPPQDVKKGFQWLDEHTKNSEIVLTDTFAGTLLPSFAGNLVYTSWWFRLSEDPHYYDKEEELNLFFSGIYSDDYARVFLKKNNISYVFYGPQERDISPWKGEPLYKVLEEVARFGSVVIYRVK